ncbi:MAG: hypothetical protein GY853_03765 [PVC group bacterium]|nr:hypothetical protein [PVC group bacterium]
MQKIKILLVMLIASLILSVNVQAQDDNYEELIGRPGKFVDGVFGVYFDRGNRQNHFCPSGWMGDFGDVKMNEKWTDNPHSGKSCIKFTYTGKGKQGANWCGVFWQNPPNNWGEKKGGFDLSEATKLTFWARGETGKERIQEFKMGGIGGTYSDSDSAGIGPVDLTTEWQQYTIDLTDVDLTYVNGGFCWSTNIDANPEGCVLYLDDIQYEQ